MSHLARIGVARSRGPAGGDATAKPITSASAPMTCAFPGSDPQGGPSSALRRAPRRGIDGKTNAADRLQWRFGMAPRIDCSPLYLTRKAGPAA
jgi:hypothetical protein